MSLIQCAKRGSEYWKKELPEEIDEMRKSQFQKELEKQMIRKYTGHWYPAEPKRGSGYRAMACTEEAGMDRMIKEAAERAGIDKKRLRNFERKVLFVDPGSVAVFDSRTPWYSTSIYKSEPMPKMEEEEHHQQQQMVQEPTILREKSTNVHHHHHQQQQQQRGKGKPYYNNQHHRQQQQQQQQHHYQQHMVTINTAKM
mmetsp:Transcript_10862/g.15918  ORF Transcript_10862/g.15918 Transcript_10862/m.15918 type:complete len:198 (+) Transcript_10862:65-658(+)